MTDTYDKNKQTLNNWMDLVKEHRDAKRFVYDQPCTPLKLISEITDKIPMTMDSSIGVMFTIEWAMYLEKAGYCDITLISDKYDHVMKQYCDKIIGCEYMTLDEIKEKDMKFDVVVGNPPFTGDKTIIDGTRGKQLFAEFTIKSLGLSDTIAMVLPSLWTHKDNKLKTELINFGLEHLSACTNHFSISIPTCYIIASEGYKGDTTISNESGETYKKNITASDDIYLNAQIGSMSIIQKMTSPYSLSDLWTRSSIYNNHSDVGKGSIKFAKIIDTKTKDIQFSTIDRDAGELPNLNKWKVITNLNLGGSSVGVISIVPPGVTASYSIIQFPVNNNDEALSLKGYLESNLVKFVFRETKNTVSKNRNIFERIPMIDLTKSWTNDDLYRHFNLTPEEIEYIESNIK